MLEIKYGDIAPEAKENFNTSSNESEFDSLSQLKEYNLNCPNFANPCELYSVLLDGNAIPFPDGDDIPNVGMWSKNISNENGKFDPGITLTLESNGQYSSQGLTLIFDKVNNIYCTDLNIRWYRVTTDGIKLLDDKSFAPDTPVYFCQNPVENYTKIEITFRSVNMPYNRLKLQSIEYGYGTIFRADELRSATCTQAIDPTSETIIINTFDFVLDSKSDIVYSFQERQPLEVYFNKQLIQATLVETSYRRAKKLWEVKSEDYIGIMEDVPFVGGMYYNKNAEELMTDIFGVAKVPHSISDEFSAVVVSGYIPYTTCREALTQVAFAIGACVDTSNSEEVKVFKINVESPQHIPLSRILQTPTFTQQKKVTSVELMYYEYIPKEIIDENRVKLYDSRENGTGEKIFVKFSEPIQLDTIVTKNGTLHECGTNYAIISSNPDKATVLVGYGYDVIENKKSMVDDLVKATEVENIKTVSGKTLVSASNVDEVLNRVYANAKIELQTEIKLVESKHITGGDVIRYGQRKYGTFKYGQKTEKVTTYDSVVNVGDAINIETEYMGDIGGAVAKERFSLGGGILIKEAEVK